MKKSIDVLDLCLPEINTQTGVLAQKIYISDRIQLKKRIYKVLSITTDSQKRLRLSCQSFQSNLYLFPILLHFSLIKISDQLSGYSYDHLEWFELKSSRNARVDIISFNNKI